MNKQKNRNEREVEGKELLFKCCYLFLSNDFVDGKDLINTDSLSLKTLFQSQKK